MQKNIPDYMGNYYNSFEQNLALAWASAHLADYLRAHPNCSGEERKTCFLNALEGGLSLALDLRENNA